MDEPDSKGDSGTFVAGVNLRRATVAFHSVGKVLQPMSPGAWLAPCESGSEVFDVDFQVLVFDSEANSDTLRPGMADYVAQRLTDGQYQVVATVVGHGDIGKALRDLQMALDIRWLQHLLR